MLRHLIETSGSEPVVELTAPEQALWWIRKGRFRLGEEWRKAHEICQREEGSKDHDWVHALVHLIEDDSANAAYWYRRAGETQQSTDPEAEWTHIAGRLSDK